MITTLDLESGPSRLRLSPEIGGSIVAWSHDGAELLRPVSPADLAAHEPRRLGCFPLIPFSGRIAWGRFSFEGVDYQLDANFGDHPHTIHGVGWHRPWAVEQREADRVVLGLEHDGSGNGARAWPWSFRSELDYRLRAGTLDVAITLQNTDQRRMPAGFGLHPYFPHTPDTLLGFRAESMWSVSADSLPAAREPIPSEWRFDPAHPPGEPPLDNCFNGWAGEARLTWPGRRSVTISAEPLFGHLIVFTPPGQGFFCVEPATHMPDAINRMGEPDNGLRVLEPGETLRGSVTFRVEVA